MYLNEVLNLYKLSDNPDSLPGYDSYERAVERAEKSFQTNNQLRRELASRISTEGYHGMKYFTFPSDDIRIKIQISNGNSKIYDEVDYFNKNIATRPHSSSEAKSNETLDQMAAREKGLFIPKIPTPPRLDVSTRESLSTFVWPERAYKKQYESLSKILKPYGLKFTEMIWTSRTIDKGWTTYKSNTFISYVGTLDNPLIIWYRIGGSSPLGSKNQLIFAPAARNFPGNKRIVLTGKFLNLPPSEQESLIELAQQPVVADDPVSRDTQWRVPICYYKLDKNHKIVTPPYKTIWIVAIGKTDVKPTNTVRQELRKHPERYNIATIKDNILRAYGDTIDGNHWSIEPAVRVK